MIVKETIKYILRKDEYFYDVFGIYWNKEKTHFLCIEQGEDRFTVRCLDEVEIIDPDIKFRTVFLYSNDMINSMPAIFHWALVEKNLLDDAIDGDKKALEEFFIIIRQEKLINF